MFIMAAVGRTGAWGMSPCSVDHPGLVAAKSRDVLPDGTGGRLMARWVASTQGTRTETPRPAAPTSHTMYSPQRGAGSKAHQGVPQSHRLGTPRPPTHINGCDLEC